MKTTLTVLLIIQLYGLASCAIKHHYYVDQAKTWDEAQQYCRSSYHDLSTFNDEIEEQQFIQDAVSQTSDAWVGLNKRTGAWTWSGGKVATRISWGANEPDNDDCALLDRNNKNLKAKPCSHNKRFFCMTFEFFMAPQTGSWEEALEYCRRYYDDLATLTSLKGRDDALSKISGAQTQYVWIGLRFLAGEWYWVSGDDVLSQLMNGQPQCPAKNRCGALQKNTNIWTTRDCEEKLNFLCF